MSTLGASELLSRQQAAACLGISVRTLARVRESGRIAGVSVSERRVAYKLSEIERYMRARSDRIDTELTRGELTPLEREAAELLAPARAPDVVTHRSRRNGRSGLAPARNGWKTSQSAARFDFVPAELRAYREKGNAFDASSSVEGGRDA